MIYQESTSKRRAQRVRIPVLLEINGKFYESDDISVLGIGIKTPKDLPININDEIRGKLILPFKDAYLTIPLELICRHKTKNKVGFEFKNLDDRKRQVLRHYIELAIEGRLEDLEDIVSSLAIKELDSPIIDGLELAEEEQLETYRKFKKHLWFWLIFGTIVILLFSYYIIYNVIFTYKTWGIITWDTSEVISPQEGLVTKINTRPGEYVKAGSILVELSDPELEEQEKLITNILTKLKKEQLQSKEKQKEIIGLLSRLLHINQKEYLEAQKLYKARKISLKDLKYIEKNYIRLAILLKEKQLIPTNQSRIVTDLEEKLASIRAQKQKLKIRTHTEGVIEELFIKQKAYISKRQKIATIRTSKPYILASVPNWKLTEIDYKEKILIFDPFTQQTYNGIITNIGVKETPDISLNKRNTFIKIDFDETPKYIARNIRVKLWFQNKTYTKIKNLINRIIK